MSHGRFPCKNSGHLRLMVISSDFLLSFFPYLALMLAKSKKNTKSQHLTRMKDTRTYQYKYIQYIDILQHFRYIWNSYKLIETQQNQLTTCPMSNPNENLKKQLPLPMNPRHVMEYPPASSHVVVCFWKDSVVGGIYRWLWWFSVDLLIAKKNIVVVCWFAKITLVFVYVFFLGGGRGKVVWLLKNKIKHQ